MQITPENYYSFEAEREFMSVSQYRDFLACEAKALAKLKNEWVEEPTTEMLVGSYVHAWVEGPEALKKFKENTPQMFKKNGEPYAQFAHADKMIECLQNDPAAMYFLEGQKEVIMTGEIGGVPWKIKIDVYNPDKKRIVEIKTTRSITELYWDARYGARVSFVEMFDYPLQMAVYLEIERQNSGRDKWLEPLILAVSKEDPPDHAVISLNDPSRLTSELEEVKRNLHRILAVKTGKIAPTRCEKCNYCRSTKKISHIIFYLDLVN